MATANATRALNKAQVFLAARISHRAKHNWREFVEAVSAAHPDREVSDDMLTRILATLRAGCQIDSAKVIIAPWGQTVDKGTTRMVAASVPPNSKKFDDGPRVYQVADAQRNLPRFEEEPDAPTVSVARPKADIVADLLD